MACRTPMTPENGLDIQDLSVIFKGDYKRIYRYIMSMVQDAKEAEDLTQETFLRAYRSRDSLREEGAQTTWLFRIATHVCYDRLRQYARRNPKEAETDLDEMDVSEPDALSLQTILEQDEMSACIQRYLTRLPDTYRSSIMLHDMHGLDAPEIARVLGESLANVKIRLHRARQKLRSALEEGCAFSYDERDVLTCESND